MALLLYGGYTMSAAITGQSGSGAAFLTNADALFDGRSGSGTSLRWTNGTQNTSSYVEITVTISANPFGESSPRKGAAGFINVQGVPYNLKTIIGGITQRLRYGPRNELCAWAFPAANGTTLVMRLVNDDGTVTPPIAAAATIAIGEIICGRVIDLPTLVYNNPSRGINDPTAFQRSAGGQLWQLMRKPWFQVGATIGRFSTADAKGGANSTLANGGNPAGVIDIQSLSMLLTTTAVCAICDTPHDGTSITVANGISYNQEFMQSNWLLARPSAIGTLTYDQPPLWSWGPQFMEAS
jgi:hypothetical protein